jgi:hypothetical protein
MIHVPVYAQAQPGSVSTAAPLQPNITEEDLNNGIAAANAWLSLVDQGKYENSWETGALSFQFTITKKEWNKALEDIRKPLGTVTSRQLLEQRVAYNPKGLPKGEYLVLYYKTSFSNKADANELLTLQKQNNGQWKVLTYHVR